MPGGFLSSIDHAVVSSQLLTDFRFPYCADFFFFLSAGILVIMLSQEFFSFFEAICFRSLSLQLRKLAIKDQTSWSVLTQFLHVQCQRVWSLQQESCPSSIGRKPRPSAIAYIV